MRRILLLLPLVLLLVALLPIFRSSPVSPAPGQGPARVTQVDASHYPDITLYVGVTDADGRPVGGLAARDFGVTEDGQPVEISGFSGAGAGPVSTVLVIDRSGSMDEEDKLEGAKDAARSFVDHMRPGDQTAIIAFSEEPELLQPFTTDKELLDRAIRRIRADGPTALYDSMIAGVEELNGATGRRALLLLTDGRDILRTGSDRQASRASLDEAIDTALKAGIAVEAIGLGERGGDDRSGIDETVLRRIAGDTGGEYFYTPSGDQLAELYRRLSASMQQEYALTYRSPRPFYDGTRRDIRVSVGGAPAAAGGYVEHHLIDVRSDPLVGLLLLLPILGALALPSLLARRTTKAQNQTASGATAHVPIDIDLGSAATGSTIMQPAGVVVLPPDVARCQSCDAPMPRVGARFCSECGASQAAVPQAAPPRRIFCDQCGRPLRDGAHFCSHCGASTPVGEMQGVRG
jgi:Ca-activated chloride channel family protein